MENDNGFISYLKSEIEEKIKYVINLDVLEFIETEDISYCITDLNCTDIDWEHEYNSLEITDLSLTDVCTIDFKFELNGKWDTEGDRPFIADKVKGNARAVIDDDEKVTYNNVIAEVIYDKPDDESDEVE